MKRFLGLSWTPHRLGRSLPIYRPLWISRGIALALTVIAGLVAYANARQALRPDVEEMTTGEAERLVVKRLARLDVTLWAPGPPLTATEAPEWLAAPPPTLWKGPHPSERPISGSAAELAARARRDLEAGDPQAAATRFLRAMDQRPSWETYYAAGLSLYMAGDYPKAQSPWTKAVRRFDDLDAAGAASPAHYAAGIATRYGAGLNALAARDCLDAIAHLRRAVRFLRRYVEVEGALVYDRKLPFAVSEAGLDNHTIWGTLAQAYAACDGRFPEEYPNRYGAQDFFDEYESADSDDIREGPYPQGLAACVDTGSSPRSSCWARSNLNKVLWASRSYLPGEGEAATRLSEPLAASLARLNYNAAWLAATSDHEEDRQRADHWLAYSARLDRTGGLPGLDQRIADLGRHLAPQTRNYSPLAEPWRRVDPSQLTLDNERSPEEVKGISWALSERWLKHLAGERPSRMIDEVDARMRTAGSFGESLREWKAAIQGQMQKALAQEIRVLHRNDNRAAAQAIRDYRAAWLGDGWSARASRAWISPEMIARWVGIFLVWALIAGLVWLIHRAVVVPYLVYTTDAYRLEHAHRHKQRRDAGRPFTRDEIEERRF